MPYRWITPQAEITAAPVELHLWPYRSLSRKGFVWVIGLAAGLISLPVLSVLGRQALWGLLPFAMLAVAALWYGIERSYQSGTMHETLILTPESLVLTREDPGRANRVWRTNPYWVRVNLRKDGPVEEYLTLTDGQREVEIGSFLSAPERLTLREELGRELARVH
ncbi:DUF2244 domain-containing protein [Paracoccus aminophilus]|uniref:Integral membrane protein n=1 Tax=Paracoccus aminophilus JCM 7686 TaxID=1367847 RepID=S5YW82_PARAH|nr:DUF2244 domain-containing protein [Paracoccus aminophilus]AGT09491.1 hypothetical protein JCM7686_2423 [Paracoccus aminophilus JCM 7686]